MKLGALLLVLSSCIWSRGRKELESFPRDKWEWFIPEIHLPVKWQKQDHTWEVKLPGTGHSSPVIWEDKIFTTCASANDSSQYVLLINSTNGKIQWQKKFPQPPTLTTNLTVTPHPHRLWIKIIFLSHGQRNNPMT